MSNTLLLIIAYLGFISLGLPDALIGVAWPSVRGSFELDQSDVAPIFIGGGISYVVSSWFTGRLINAFGIGLLLTVSSAIVALCNFGYGVASMWVLFAACPLLHGVGSGAIDAGLNHYVAHHFSARHMNWLHACYSLGAATGPVIMTVFIVRRGGWRWGYLTVAAILLVLCILFAITRRKWDQPASANSSDASKPTGIGRRAALRHPIVWMQLAFFFFYTGLEITVGNWCFTLLTEARNVPKGTAGIWVTIYWASIFVGRLLFGFIVDHIGIDRVLRFSVISTVVGTIFFASHPSDALSALALALIGLSLAPIYPCMMTKTPQRLGSEISAHVVGFQVSAAMLGGAALPSLCGFLAQHDQLEIIAIAAVVMAVALLLLYELIRKRVT